MNVVVGAREVSPARRWAVLALGVVAARRARACDRQPTQPAAITSDGDGFLAA